MKHLDFFSNFYVMTDPLSKRNFRGNLVNRIGDFAELLRSDIRLDSLDIEYFSGEKEPKEIFWSTLFDPIGVKSNVIDILESNNLLGWTKTPAKVKDKFQKHIDEDFFGLSVYGRVDPLDYLQSDVFMKQMPGGLFPYFKGLRFNPESWDVSDIFMERKHHDGRETAQIFVTKRFVEIFKKHKLKNIKFTNFNEYEIPCHNITSIASGALQIQLEEKIKKAYT